MMSGNDAFLDRLLHATGIEHEVTRLPERLVTRALASEYGLTGKLTRIRTEKDDTFSLESDRGRLLVKVAPAAEARQVVDLQSSAMIHVGSRDPEVPIQRIIRGAHGQVDAVLTDPAGRARVMRVFSYIDGPMLHQVAATPRQLARTGAMLARLDDALADFRHPCESRLLLWDLTHFAKLRQLVSYVADRADRELAHRVFDAFEAQVMAMLPELETQVIHGDFSPFNIVVDSTSPRFVTGVIDFGDVARSPVLFELSVAAANQLGVDTDDPWASALEIVRGYREVRALRQEVVELIAYAAPARLLLRALIYGWRSAHDPRSREYARAHSGLDWQRLRTALAVDSAVVRAKLASTEPSVPV
jgi:Ser/Thr protein kinase RdoA (MazF antagonist)